MKKVILLVSIFLLFILNSCEEDFNPYASFQQQYALFCVLNGDTTYQFTSISKTYPPDGFDQNEDPTIKDAVVTIFYNDSTYQLKDTLIEQELYGPSTIYSTNSLIPEPNRELRIEAKLNNGQVLTGETVTPKSNKITFQPVGIATDYLIYQKPEGQTVVWDFIDVPNEQALFLPTLTLVYYKRENGTDTKMQYLIPLHYFFENGDYIRFESIVTPEKSITYSMDVINRAMNEISENDSLKFNYFISHVDLDLIILDQNLAPYVLTNQTFLNGYTIILNQQNYSNIVGGFGVFGSFYKRTLKMSIQEEYIESFNYRVYDNLP